MLEFVGTLAVCAAVIWLIRYLWRFWQYRRSISVLEQLAVAIKVKGDLVATSLGQEAADSSYLIAVCLKGVANSLSYGNIASKELADTQLNILEGLIESPKDVAYYMDISQIDSLVSIRMSLLRARDSFLMLRLRNGIP